MSIPKLFLKALDLPERVFQAIENYIKNEIIGIFNAYNMDDTGAAIGSEASPITNIYAATGNFSTTVRAFTYSTLTATNMVFQINGSTKWYINGTTYEFQPLINNLYDVGTDSASVRAVYGYTGDFKTAVITPLVGTDTAAALNIQINSSNRWNYSTSGHHIPDADSTYDVGSDAIRVRKFYSDSMDISDTLTFEDHEKPIITEGLGGVETNRYYWGKNSINVTAARWYKIGEATITGQFGSVDLRATISTTNSASSSKRAIIEYFGAFKQQNAMSGSPATQYSHLLKYGSFEANNDQIYTYLATDDASSKVYEIWLYIAAAFSHIWIDLTATTLSTSSFSLSPDLATPKTDAEMAAFSPTVVAPLIQDYSYNISSSLMRNMSYESVLNIGTISSNVMNFVTNNTIRWYMGSGGDLIPNASVSYNIGSGSNLVKKIHWGGTTTSTNFKSMGTFGQTNFFTSDGTDPETNLTGVIGDWCFSGDGTGKIWYCDTSGTNWTLK